MARVSKKVSAAQREAENAPHRIWKTAIYARLSDFDDVLRNAESLEVQISYIKEYINHRDDLMLLDVFADKRCTGKITSIREGACCKLKGAIIRMNSGSGDKDTNN